MLSYILSRIFGVVALIICISGAINLVVQINNSPIKFTTKNKGQWSFGSPGIFVKAIRTNVNEPHSFDTVINYSLISKNGSKANGMLVLNRPTNFGDDVNLKNVIKTKLITDSFKIDTQYNYISLIKEKSENYFEKKRDAKVNKNYLPKGAIAYFDDNSKSNFDSMYILNDYVYPNKKTALFSLMDEGYSRELTILQDNAIIETLRIKASSTRQLLLIILIVSIQIICYALLFFNLRNLFKNFSKGDYFVLSNIKFLKKIGILFLIPQAISLLIWWLYFKNLKLCKLELGDELKTLAYYNIQSDLDWTLIFLGLALLVLSYIFKEGLLLKEEQVYTI